MEPSTDPRSVSYYGTETRQSTITYLKTTDIPESGLREAQEYFEESMNLNNLQLEICDRRCDSPLGFFAALKIYISQAYIQLLFLFLIKLLSKLPCRI